MAQQVIWQDQAVEQFESIQKYLFSEWGEQATIRFTQNVFNHLELIRRYPAVGSAEFPERNIRGFTITKQTTVLYQFDEKAVYLLAFFDNRQDPSKKVKV